MPRVTITVPDRTAQPYRFQLDRKVVTLGRGEENDIMIDSGSVSVHHAEMRRVDGGYELHDTGSTNGVKLDGERYSNLPLRNGMTAHIGDAAFDFLLSDEELSVLSGEKSTGVTPVARESDLPPAPKPPARQVYAPARQEGGGFIAILLFLILAAAAFFAGLAVRYQKETGGSLIHAISSKPAVAPAPAQPAPVLPAPEAKPAE